MQADNRADLRPPRGIRHERQATVRVRDHGEHGAIVVTDGEGGVGEVHAGRGSAGAVLADEDIARAGGGIGGEVRGSGIEHALDEGGGGGL